MTPCCEGLRPSGFNDTPHIDRHTTHRQRTQCLTQTFCITLGSRSVLGRDVFLLSLLVHPAPSFLV